jgi:hypothetical protein
MLTFWMSIAPPAMPQPQESRRALRASGRTMVSSSIASWRMAVARAAGVCCGSGFDMNSS